jgi:hypothetical protein
VKARTLSAKRKMAGVSAPIRSYGMVLGAMTIAHSWNPWAIWPARSFLEAALAAAADDALVGRRIELLAFLCYLATEELDLAAAIDAGDRALVVAAAGSARSELALAGGCSRSLSPFSATTCGRQH